MYSTYGKLYFVVFLGFLLGLMALRVQQRGHVGRLGEWGFRLSIIGVALNLFGNIADYWIGEDTWFEELGFIVGELLGLLSLLVGSTMLGIALLRAGTTPRIGAWLLVLSLPGIILLLLVGFANIPSGPALWFCFAWLGAGVRALVAEEDGSGAALARKLSSLSQRLPLCSEGLGTSSSGPPLLQGFSFREWFLVVSR